MFLHSLKGLKKHFDRERKYPDLGKTMRSALEIAEELNRAREKQMEAERQKRPDIAVIQKARYEALMWALGKDATSVNR